MNANTFPDVKDEFPRGVTVEVRRMIDDMFFNDFVGTVIGYHAEYVIVQDQEGECWDCCPEQLVIVKDWDWQTAGGFIE